jgi:DNA-binding NtrC family response regulator
VEIVDELNMKQILPKWLLQERHRELNSNPLVAQRKHGILVVDDDRNVRDFLNTWLQKQEFKVLVASNGLEAFDLYQRHRETIDIVLIDVRMHDMDGPQTFALLRQINPQVRCCFMSGDLGNYTEKSLYDLGAIALFWKPFPLAEFAETLSELTESVSIDENGQIDRWKDDGGREEKLFV